jgi:hypothetical protein
MYSDFDVTMIETQLNKVLDTLGGWPQANRLSLNVIKSEYMIIASRKRLASLSRCPIIKKVIAILKESNSQKH